jgi:hypothetical protein
LVAVPDDDPDHNPAAGSRGEVAKDPEYLPPADIVKRDFKKGDIVQIFQDPITREDFEGEAELLEKHTEDFEQEFWKVKFNDGDIRQRWIHKKQGILSTRVA